MGYPGCVAAALCRLPVRDLAPSRPLPALFSSFMNDSIRVVPSSLYSTRPSITTLSDSEKMLRDTVSRFAETRVAPLVQQMDIAQKIDDSLLRDLFEQGFMAIEVPLELGGGGMTFFDSVLVIEELSKVDPSVSLVVDVQNTIFNNIFIRWGTDSQKEQFLPRLARSTVGSFCLSEWGSGSDAFALKSFAREDGDHFVLNGTKAWISNAELAGLFIVFANTDFSLGYKGITAFIVEKEFPGISISSVGDKMCLRSSSTCEIVFTDVRVPKRNIMGKVGEGYKVAIEILNEGRIGVAAQMVGTADGALSKTLPYIQQRTQFGSPVGSFQGMEHQFSRCAIDIETSRLLTYNAARLKLEDKPFVIESAMAKVHASEVAERVTSMCVNMLGGVGITREMGVEKFFRDCKAGQIYEGATNVVLNTIAQLVQKRYQ